MKIQHTDLRIKGVSKTDRAVECVASTEDIDSYGDVVCQRSWRLERFKTNPVVLFGHNSRDLPIGKAENLRITHEGLCTRIVFASATANPNAERVLQLIECGMLNGISVGFVPGKVREEFRNGKSINVLENNELHEISVVPIPANAQALIRAKAAGLLPADIESWGNERWRPIQEALRSAETQGREPRGESSIHESGISLAQRIFGDDARHNVVPLSVEKDAIRKNYLTLCRANREKNGSALADRIFGQDDSSRMPTQQAARAAGNDVNGSALAARIFGGGT